MLPRLLFERLHHHHPSLPHCSLPVLVLLRTLGKSVSRDSRFPVVAKGTLGLSLKCLSCGRAGGGGGRANLEGTSALFPPLLCDPSSQKGWYSLLRWGWNVPCVRMASVQSYTGRFIFILPSSAVESCCQSPLLSSARLPPHACPTVCCAQVLNSCRRWG